MAHKPFLYETHLHTQESSRCGVTSAQDITLYYKKLGFAGVFVTDHFVTGHSYGNIDAPWEMRIDILLNGYTIAKKTGDAIGLDVFLAWEYPYEGGDFLTYGLDADFLYSHSELGKVEINSDFNGYAKLVHENGGFIVQAHPFREAEYIQGGIAKVQEKCIDGIEVLNGSHKDARFDERALQKAQELHLPMTAGSDVHGTSMAKTSYMAFDKRLRDAQDFISQLKAGSGELIKNKV